MRAFRLIPDDTRIHFMRYEYWAYAFSAALVLLTLILVPLKGLNFGIDFRGGILIEVRMPGAAADLGAMRATLGGLGLGEVALQEFGEPSDVLIRVQRQEGGEEAQQAAVAAVRGGARPSASARTSPTAGSSSSGPRSARSCSGPAPRRWSTRCSRSWPTSGSASSGSTASARSSR